MDRRWSRKIQPRLFCSVKIHDLITATWRYSSSRRWWSSKIWRSGRTVWVKVCGYFALVNSSLNKLLGKRRRTEEKVSVLLWPWFFRTKQSSDIQEVLSLILHCKTMYCYRMTSLCTCTTSGTLMTCTPSSSADWFREEKVSNGTGNPCFSQPWNRCTPLKIQKKFSTIWINPESRCTKTLGEFTQIQHMGAIWNSPREKDCSSIRHDPTQSPFPTLYLRCVLRKWYTWRLERIYTAKYTNP